MDYVFLLSDVILRPFTIDRISTVKRLLSSGIKHFATGNPTFLTGQSSIFHSYVGIPEGTHKLVK